MKIRVGTFNLENMFLRYRILNGDRAGPYNPKPVPFNEIADFLQEYSKYIEEFGGADKILNDPQLQKEFYKKLSTTNNGKRILAKFLLEGVTINNLQIDHIYSINETQRKSTAKAIRGEDNEMTFPDIMAIQEVENLNTLKDFNSSFLDSHFKYKYLIDGNDNRQIDVGFYSNYPAVRIQTHQFIKDSDGKPLFSRDCLEVDFALTEQDETKIDSNTPILTVFNNHLKSKFVDYRLKGSAKEKAEKDAESKRKRQADEVTTIVKNRCKDKDFGQRNFIVCGDLNDTPSSNPLVNLLGFGMENAISRIGNGDITKEWTYYYPKDNKIEQIDYLLLSPALSKKIKMPYHL
jgi:endonuclease/exonuclease/phosphatase family metal-dependent hydrolase